MKEIAIISITLSFIGLLLFGAAIFVTIYRLRLVERTSLEQVDFDCYVFITPDGMPFTATQPS
jgi:hypothetical protein